jgi:hypothetical protein
VTLAAGAVFRLAPALRASAVEKPQTATDILVIAQMAVSVVLLAGTVLRP